jgi:hypothetical protein
LAREYFERLMSALPELRQFFENLTEERLRDAEVINEDLLVEDDERVFCSSSVGKRSRGCGKWGRRDP